MSQETQFRNLFDKLQKPGKTGENTTILLETRLDNVVSDLDFSSEKEAEQLITHNGHLHQQQKANIPSAGSKGLERYPFCKELKKQKSSLSSKKIKNMWPSLFRHG